MILYDMTLLYRCYKLYANNDALWKNTCTITTLQVPQKISISWLFGRCKYKQTTST